MSEAKEKYLTDVCMVTLTTKETEPRVLSWKTASKVAAKIKIEETKGVKLIVKQILKAQKKDSKIITGCELSFEDNVFLPEVVQVLQGGTVTFDDTSGKFKKYAAPVVGDTTELTKFDIDVYTANYGAGGAITGYTKINFPNCTGQPIDIEAQDDKFFAPKYTIASAPDTGESPYTMEDVENLPSV